MTVVGQWDSKRASWSDLSLILQLTDLLCYGGMLMLGQRVCVDGIPKLPAPFTEHFLTLHFVEMRE